jgi:hypothetical protein
MRHVPYRGAGPALTDLLGGQLQMMFNITPSSLEYVRAASCARWRGSASAHPGTRLLMSSAGSIRRSMPCFPIPK